jgi:hypothetical protein
MSLQERWELSVALQEWSGRGKADRVSDEEVGSNSTLRVATRD